MAIDTNTINYLIQTIEKIEREMIIHVERVQKKVDDGYELQFSVFPNVENNHSQYRYKLEDGQTFDLGVDVLHSPSVNQGYKTDERLLIEINFRQHAKRLHRDLNAALFKQLIAEDGTPLFDKNCPEAAKPVLALYRAAILERLAQDGAFLPAKGPKAKELDGFRGPYLGGCCSFIAFGSSFGVAFLLTLLLSAMGLSFAVLAADGEDFLHGGMTKQEESGVAKIMVFSALVIAGVILTIANPIGGALGFALLSVCSVVAVAALYRAAKYLINCVDPLAAHLHLSKEQRDHLLKTYPEDKVNTVANAIDVLVEVDKRLYGPNAVSRMPFWHKPDKIKHRNILTMIDQFKNIPADDQRTETKIVEETALLAADSVLRA